LRACFVSSSIFLHDLYVIDTTELINFTLIFARMKGGARINLLGIAPLTIFLTM